MKINALIATKNTEIAQLIENILKQLQIEVVISSDWKSALFSQETYSYYLVDQNTLEPGDSVRVSSTSILIGLIHEASFENARMWMKNGAFDVILIPHELDALKTILEKTSELIRLNRMELLHDDVGGGRVSAFYSAKGGSGKTMVASMFAQCLKVNHEKRVILIDLNAQYGGVEAVFGIDPIRSYYDLRPVIKELSLTHILNVSVNDQTTGVQILLGPANPEKAEQLPEELISKVIRICRANFDHVVLDLPSAFNPISYTGLQEATDIYYLLTPESMAIRSLKQATTLFRRFHLGNKEKLSIIVNRKHRKSELTEKDIARLVDIPIAGTIQSDYFAIQPTINMGRPFYRKKKEKVRTKVSLDVRKIVEKVMK
ncbi:AAA family ATPase [Brevibacillus migulae]|uniref:AAA family ATPase n=1 Tax=Brevibacillus migulae TaxID=1644114 RepID=UPI00106E1ECE|nr:AAA family ATPase [Brevibacillus migulae]